ncbi:hypothetical protein ACIPEN_18200 [Herbaspirillum chlorophenolicum]|uniref:Uncharacterized protein n=1 Tax=Herbaspirillum chlorophenolicum TaxID=211589 RepID=A0ABW8F397_9BURK
MENRSGTPILSAFHGEMLGFSAVFCGAKAHDQLVHPGSLQNGMMIGQPGQSIKKMPLNLN